MKMRQPLYSQHVTLEHDTLLLSCRVWDILTESPVLLGLLCVFCFRMADGSTFLNSSRFSFISPIVGGAPWLLILYQPLFFGGCFSVFLFCATCENWYMLITCPVLGTSSDATSSLASSSSCLHNTSFTAFYILLHTEFINRFHSGQVPSRWRSWWNEKNSEFAQSSV